MRLEFAHAIFERRLTDAYISVEYVDSHPLGNKGPGVAPLREPLHDNSAAKIVEAVENLARLITHTAYKQRCRIKCSRLSIFASEIRLTVYEFQGIS